MVVDVLGIKARLSTFSFDFVMARVLFWSILECFLSLRV